MVDEPSNGKYYGGEVAAPVFAQVMGASLRTLGVAPDAPTTATSVPQAAPAGDDAGEEM
jgi:cell division protein FtsI (penicillin-binding protein 3)